MKIVCELDAMKLAAILCVAATRGSVKAAHNSFAHRMVAIYALVSCLMTATYAAAIEHPRRQSRSQVPLEVSVTQTNIDFYPGETITITCQARAGASVEDMPFISFYLQFGPYTTMPLSSGSPGVVVSSRPATDYRASPFAKTTSKTLTLGEDAYDTWLRDGMNYLYCKGWNHRGLIHKKHFEINKIPYYDV